MRKILRTLEEYSNLPLRLGLGSLFLFAGISKAIGMAGTIQMFAGMGFPGAKFFAILVMAAEIVGGAFLVFGLLTRYAAAWLTIVMLVALFVVHIKHPDLSMFFVISAIGGLLSIVFSGAKKPSLDDWFLID